MHVVSVLDVMNVYQFSGLNTLLKLRELTLDKLFIRRDEELNQPAHKEPPEGRFFSSIYGYWDIKKLLMRAIISRESISILLCGPPASSKTIFLMEMMKGLDNSCYTDCTNTTGAGLVDKLFNNDIQYLLLDEAEKLSKKDQNVLLNVLETGMLIETKVSKTRTKQIKNLKVFATTNNVEALSPPLRSRFMEFHLPEYTFDQFCEIARRLLSKRFGHSNQVADEIAAAVWNEMNSKDIRDVLSIAKLVRSIEDVSWLIQIKKKYERIEPYSSICKVNNSFCGA
jgi:replication-associated recombination protein RarA